MRIPRLISLEKLRDATDKAFEFLSELVNQETLINNATIKLLQQALKNVSQEKGKPLIPLIYAESLTGIDQITLATVKLKIPQGGAWKDFGNDSLVKLVSRRARALVMAAGKKPELHRRLGATSKIALNEIRTKKEYRGVLGQALGTALSDKAELKKLKEKLEKRKLRSKVLPINRGGKLPHQLAGQRPAVTERQGNIL